MSVGRILGVLVFLSLLATGAAFAGGNLDRAGIKGDPALPKNSPATVRHTKPQAPIVMGRSVSAHRKTKLHHVKLKPLESIDNPVSADKPR